jgi:hypothetical protein
MIELTACPAAALGHDLVVVAAPQNDADGALHSLSAVTFGSTTAPSPSSSPAGAIVTARHWADHAAGPVG